MKFKHYASSALLLLSLCGCAFYTGVDMKDKVSDEVVTKKYAKLNKLVNIYLVSPDNINQFKDKPVEAKHSYLLDLEKKTYEYKVGIGDILNITVWNHPELTTPAGTYRSPAESGIWVQPDGNIFYPFVGAVAVAGKTIGEIRKDLIRRLAVYIESPQIDINIASFLSQRAYMTGAVRQPGSVPINNIPLTLIDAVNKTGGLSNTADWKNVTVTRAGEVRKFSLDRLIQFGDMTQNILLRNGDIIHVPFNQDSKVFVLGEVSRPQTLTVDRVGMSLTEALSKVGGLDKINVDASGIFVIRNIHDTEIKNAKIANIYQFNLENATAFILSNKFNLKPNDVVYVTSSPISKWNTVISQLLPTISGLNTPLTAINNFRAFN